MTVSDWDASQGAEVESCHVPDSKLLHAVAQAFSYPTAGIGETLSELRAYADAVSFDERGDRQVAEAVRAVLDASSCFDDLVQEQLAYTRLFIGSLKMEAPPYASFYTSDNHTLNGRSAVEVAAVYNQFGLQLDRDEIAPPDHLRYMLMFVSLLAARFEETGEDAFAEAYGDFTSAYITPWYGQFQSLVNEHSEGSYYPALVALIACVL